MTDRRGDEAPPDEALAETVDSSSPVASAVEAGQPEIGELLGTRYELLARLGQGAFGTVFRAHDRVADRIVAIKVMSRDALRSPQTLRRIRRELQAAVQVTHPSVVRIHDLLEVDGRFFLSMELIEGETLAERLRRPPRLSTPDLLSLTDHLTQALAAAHAVGVIHRDLKPANIMIRTSTGHAVVTDFGLSRFGHAREQPSGSGSAPREVPDPSLTLEGEMMGTPQYMAPEQMIGRDVGAAADIYALGVILFEAATGRRPHEASSIPELFALRQYEPPQALSTLRPDLPAWFCRVVDRCLKADQKARYADGAELRHEIAEEFAPPTGRRSRPAIQVVRRRFALGVPIVLVAIASAGFWLWRARPLPRGDRRLTIAVRNDGVPADAWMGAALARMAAWGIRDRARGYAVSARSDEANVVLELGYRRDAGGVRLTPTVGRSGGRRLPLEEVREKSVFAAVEKLVDQLDTRIGQGQPERGPDSAEQMEMRSLGTTSFAAYRLYRRAIREYFRSIDADPASVQRMAEEALRLQPDWAHAHALLILSEGGASPRLPALLRRAAEQTAAAADVGGRTLLGAIAASSNGDRTQATRMLDEQFRSRPQDLLIGWTLYLGLSADQRTDEALAVARSLHERYPELQFGVEVAYLLRIAGRAAEIPALQKHWLELSPESEQALASQAQVYVEQGQSREAVGLVRQVLLLHGEAPPRLVMLADVLTLAGEYAEAGDMATRLLRGSELDRARAHNRLGNLAVVQGRFTAAYDSFERAVGEARATNDDFEILTALEGLRSLAPLVAGRTELVKHLRALEERLQTMGRVGRAATARFERELEQARAGRCPDLATALRDVPVGDAHRIAQRATLRAAASHGCGRCSAVLRAGQSAEERSTLSLFEFGLCAEQEGALTLAADVFDHIEKSNPKSFFHWVLAIYHRGRVLERMNRPNDARAAYQQFLGHWRHSDRALAEVDDAVRALERLH